MTSFRCDAVDFCESLKIELICTLKGVSSVSGGISTYGEEIRDAVEAREFKVCIDDLWDTALDVLVDLVPETLPGILVSTMFLAAILYRSRDTLNN